MAPLMNAKTAKAQGLQAMAKGIAASDTAKAEAQCDFN